MQFNDISMYLAHNEGKFVVAERIIKTSTLIWMDFSGVRFEGNGGSVGVKITLPCLKLVIIIPETSNLARK